MLKKSEIEVGDITKCSPAGLLGVTGSDRRGWLGPIGLTAVTRNTYSLPSSRLVAEYLVVRASTEPRLSQCSPSREASMMNSRRGTPPSFSGTLHCKSTEVA